MFKLFLWGGERRSYLTTILEMPIAPSFKGGGLYDNNFKNDHWTLILEERGGKFLTEGYLKNYFPSPCPPNFVI